jgi:hypothetical protein
MCGDCHITSSQLGVFLRESPGWVKIAGLPHFFTIFCPRNKAKPVLNTIYSSMRSLRILAAAACYFVSTAVNNREPLFWCSRERARFKRVLDEAHVLYSFVLYGLCFDGPTVSFYIKPADGLQLPEIMQWIKQTYACRYNVYDGRTGHIWGDRYWSKVLEEEPPEEEIAADGSVRGDCAEKRTEEGGQIPKARLREGPPGGDSLRMEEPARKGG